MINITLSVRIRPRVGVRSEGTKPLLTLDANLLFFYGLLAAPQFPVHSANTKKKPGLRLGFFFFNSRQIIRSRIVETSPKTERDPSRVTGLGYNRSIALEKLDKRLRSRLSHSGTTASPPA